jgi:hypothetical protein
MPGDTTRLLSDVSEQELLELAASNPKVYKALVDSDPRVRLFETLYKKPEFAAKIEEMGIEVAPESSLARARRHASAAIADDVTAVKQLRKELEDGKKKDTETRFHQDVQDAATELGYTVSDKDLGDLVTFMKDNEYGPKAVKKAVEAFYEGREPAEPNFVSEHTFQFEDEGSDYIKKLTEAPPFTDTSTLTLQHAEKVWGDMFGKKGGPGLAKRALTGR